MNTNMLLRHAALVCENAARGLPVRFANGRPVARPDQPAKLAFAARARKFTATAARLDGRSSRVIPFVRPARCLPGALPTTGTLTASENSAQRLALLQAVAGSPRQSGGQS